MNVSVALYLLYVCSAYACCVTTHTYRIFQCTISDADAVVDNFASCPLRAAMCCIVSDRQANDNNGNCAEPYDDNCVNADPADNTE